MRRTILVIAAFFVVALVASSACFAQTAQEIFNLSADIPEASGVSIDANRVVGTTWTPVGNSLAYNMNYDTVNEIWMATEYYAVDVAPTGGTGNPTTSVVFQQGNNPNGGTTHGLGVKGSATFVSVTGPTGAQTETALVAHPKEVFGTVSETIQPSELIGGFLRMYFGINTGEEGTMPPTAEVFTNSDAPGSYEGTMTISATLP